jgi:mycothiol synthase
MTRIRKFTNEDYPAIVTIHNSLNIAWPERPRTPQGWAEADRQRNPKYRFQRWVAEVDGQVAGHGSYGQGGLDYHPQRFYVNVEVNPARQCQGIGAGLYDRIMAELEPFEPRLLRADAFTNLPQGYSFLQKRGFREVFRETPVHLDIASFDFSPYAGLEAKLLKKGIVIKTVKELESDPQRDRKLYELYWETFEDVPQEDAKIEPQDFDEWVKWGLNDPTNLHEAFFVALRGEEYIGLRELYKDPDNNALLGSLLGVRRVYRKDGVGLALQLRGIRYARENDIPLLKTCTAIHNIPMQALFNKLGYCRGPEWQQCQKDL